MLSSRLLCWRRAMVIAGRSLTCVILTCLYLFWHPSGQLENFDLSFEYSPALAVSSAKEPLASVRDWRTLIPDVFVYAAHMASPEAFGQELHITAITKLYDTSRCFCTYPSSSKNASSLRNVTERAILENLWERHNLFRTASRFRCPLPSSPVPFQKVGLTCKSKNTPKREGFVEFLLSGRCLNSTIKEFSIALCVGSSLRGKYSDDPSSVIEFVEYHRILGVDKFFFYITDVSTRVLRVLEHYERTGVAELMNWTLPFKAERIHYFGQVALINDCFLRTSSRWDFTGHRRLNFMARFILCTLIDTFTSYDSRLGRVRRDDELGWFERGSS
ncbi:hypothetical protein RvY_13230-2 [Ramazzottius varieornatus]|uniref:Glycosyltransferase family 92 protein n=1 Tax=Ramazzottius varieornatus TaxID=947166 RepID=A0A1D1VM79_RAMVA|nr:hypothetical protein RvY_13230-2 [Ramazzottius varieornatus]